MTSSLLDMREYKFLKVISELPDLGHSCIFHTWFFHTLCWLLLCQERSSIVGSRWMLLVGDANINQGLRRLHLFALLQLSRLTLPPLLKKREIQLACVQLRQIQPCHHRGRLGVIDGARGVVWPEDLLDTEIMASINAKASRTKFRFLLEVHQVFEEFYYKFLVDFGSYKLFFCHFLTK